MFSDMNQVTDKPRSQTILEKGQRRTGVVKRITDIGVIVTLEEGIQGTVHVSEITWKDMSHPSEIVRVGDKVRVTILKIDTKQQRLWLSMKAIEPHPWDIASTRYSVGAEVTGTVRNLVKYGAFVEIEMGIEGLLHVNDMSETREIGHASEMIEKGQKINCRILSIDRERRRIRRSREGY